ncbi:HEAT repeat family protein [Geobacillus kaustophilus]|uniref:HEAT repeat family protein n=1 Tax=Geobacillus kaustophilus TaxID=1462 RepID=A0A0D8BS28_GEOKU|nr:HEAT repeat domain-containing protein [Geobacillus kaustophilus]KJE27018.1 HEAT repeat family protein [Geobacillus kaustophilus]
MALLVVTAAAVALFTLLSNLFLYLVVRKWREKRRQVRICAYKERHRLGLLRYLLGEEEQLLLPASPLEREAMIELLDHFAALLKGEQVQARIRALAEEHFQGWLRRRLSSRHWSERMNALFLIEDLRMQVMVPEMERLYRSDRVTRGEEAKLLAIFAQFDYSPVVAYVLEPKYELTEFAYRVIFGHMSERLLRQVEQRFDELPPAGKCAFVDMIGIRRREERSFLLELLASDELELRVRALKAMAEIGMKLEAARLEQHLCSPYWQERLMAARLAGKCREERLLPLLYERLSDRSFVVRSEAAAAIARLPGGRAVLRTAARTASDRYARDMARQWLRGEE